MEEHIAADGAFTAVRIPGSGSPNARQAVFKTVGERERHVVLGVRPMRVLIEPPGVTVSDVDVPITLTTDKGPVLVTRFTDDGVVLDERKGPGLELRVTVIDGERSSVAEDPNLRRTRRIRHATELIQKQMNVADALEQRMRGETAWSKPTFDAFVKDMYDWRSDAARALAQILPKGGASTRFLEANGETGQSPVRYEYTKLLSLKSNLALILDRLDSWIDRSDFDTRN